MLKLSIDTLMRRILAHEHERREMQQEFVVTTERASKAKRNIDILDATLVDLRAGLTLLKNSQGIIEHAGHDDTAGPDPDGRPLEPFNDYNRPRRAYVEGDYAASEADIDMKIARLLE